MKGLVTSISERKNHRKDSIRRMVGESDFLEGLFKIVVTPFATFNPGEQKV